MDKQRDNIEKYLAGKLYFAEMHALEKKSPERSFPGWKRLKVRSRLTRRLCQRHCSAQWKLTKRKIRYMDVAPTNCRHVIVTTVSMFVIWVTLKKIQMKRSPLNRAFQRRSDHKTGTRNSDSPHPKNKHLPTQLPAPPRLKRNSFHATA